MHEGDTNASETPPAPTRASFSFMRAARACPTEDQSRFWQQPLLCGLLCRPWLCLGGPLSPAHGRCPGTPQSKTMAFLEHRAAQSAERLKPSSARSARHHCFRSERNPLHRDVRSSRPASCHTAGGRAWLLAVPAYGAVASREWQCPATRLCCAPSKHYSSSNVDPMHWQRSEQASFRRPATNACGN